ncbi:MAG: hypothetical protein H8E15_08950 [Planctomycetes bacterium]|nr:hypothetical protein [Planctomycetota bacterium]
MSSTFALARRDPAMVKMPFFMALSVAFGAAVGAMVLPPEQDVGMAGAPLFFRILIITDLVVVLAIWTDLVAQFHTKAYPFQLNLPVANVQLWKSRLLASYAATFGPIIIGTLVFSLISGDYFTQSFQLWVRTVLILAVLPVAVHFAGSIKRSSYFLVATPLRIAVVAIVLGLEWIGAWLQPSIWLTSLLVAAAIAAMVVAVRRSLPQQFQLGGLTPMFSSKGRLQDHSEPLAKPVVIPALLAIPIISPVAKLNRYLAADIWVRSNMYVVILGAIMMVWTSTLIDNSYAIFELALVQGFYLVFAIFGLPRVAFLPIPRWRLFLQGAGQGLFVVLLCLIMLAASGRLPIPDEGLLSAEAAAIVLLWCVAWLLSMTAFIHFFLTYPAVFWQRLCGIGLKIIHAAAAIVLTFWAMPGDLSEQTNQWLPDIAQLHQLVAILLPNGVSAWFIVSPVAALFYWVTLQLFKRIQVTRLKDRLVKSK